LGYLPATEFDYIFLDLAQLFALGWRLNIIESGLHLCELDSVVDRGQVQKLVNGVIHLLRVTIALQFELEEK
jgi:hypothetical protein